MKVLDTDRVGFVGGFICEYMIKVGDEVTATYRKHSYVQE